MKFEAFIGDNKTIGHYVIFKYKDGMSIRRIQAELEQYGTRIGYGSIRGWLIHNKVPMRPRGGSRPGSRRRPRL